MLGKSSENLLWVLVAYIIGVPLVYVIVTSPAQVFWDSLVSGTASTALALIGGIPIAMAIDRALKRKEAERRQQEAEKLETELLKLFRDELSANKSLLADRMESPDSIQLQPLKSNLWHACVASGRLNTLKDDVALYHFSDIYGTIDTVNRIEQLAYKAINSATISYGDGTTAAQRLGGHARSFDQKLSNNLDSLIDALEVRLEE